LLANNDTIQVIDPMEDFDSSLQVAVAVNNALNDLYVKGAYNEVHIAPVYDAPEPYHSRVERRMLEYASSLGRLIKAPQPQRGYLLLGATAYAHLDREPPTYYDKDRRKLLRNSHAALRRAGVLHSLHGYSHRRGALQGV
jgi:selenophosphate synthase